MCLRSEGVDLRFEGGDVRGESAPRICALKRDPQGHERDMPVEEFYNVHVFSHEMWLMALCVYMVYIL